MGQADEIRKFLFKPLQHKTALVAVDSPQLFQVLVKINGGQEAVSQHLRPDVGVHRAGLKSYDRLCDYLGRTQQIAYAQSRRKGLGERPAVKHIALCVKFLDGLHVLALEAKRSVGVVLENIHAVLLGERQYLPAALERCSPAGGVLEVRDSVDEFCGGVGFQGFFKAVRLHSIVVHRNADKRYAVASERIQRTYERGILAYYHVALVAEYLRGGLDSLLCAAGDDYLVAIAEQAFPGKVGFKPLAQPGIALGDGVLQRVYRLLAEDISGELRDGIHRECLGSGVARCEAYYLGVGGEFKYLAYRRGLQPGHAVGKRL